MNVIRTKFGRIMVKPMISAAAALSVAVCTACSVPSVLRMFVFQSDADGSGETVGNMNGSGTLLYTSVNNGEETEKKESTGYEQPVPEDEIYESDETETLPDETTSSSAVNTFPGKYLTTLNRSSEKEDLTLFDVHSGAIYEETFGKGSGPEYIELSGGAQIRNCTEIPNETVSAVCADAQPFGIKLYSDAPQVLIVHTHTTESYEPYTKDWYDERYVSRSYDPGNSVIAVGDAIAAQLASSGISVIHDCTIHDNVYNGAYGRSLAATLGIMEQYPSVKIVLDIHRDAIEYQDGTRVSAVTEINGRKAAQVMIICAADDGTYDVPGFYGNLRFAGSLQSSMESMYPTLTRPVLFQYCQYNQQVSPGALLIEVGSHGNSIDEAVYSGELIGNSLAALLTDDARSSEPAAVPVLAGFPMYFLDRVR